VIRAKLWDPRHWPDIGGVPSLARAVVDHAKLARTAEQVQSVIDAQPLY
jgi:hypothetical protein